MKKPRKMTKPDNQMPGTLETHAPDLHVLLKKEQKKGTRQAY